MLQFVGFVIFLSLTLGLESLLIFVIKSRGKMRDSNRGCMVQVPGSGIRSVVVWVYSKKSMTRIFEPILADMQNEWLEAILEGRKVKAWWVRIRGYHSIYSAAGLHVIVSTGRKLLSIWKMTQ